MITNCTRIEYRLGDKLCHFYCDQDVNTAQIRDVANHMIAQMVEIEKKMAEMHAQEQEKIVKPDFEGKEADIEA